jgi:hypothetical protein
MNSLSVSDNIQIQKDNIAKLIQQKVEIDKEILRLEGSIRVFNSFKELGIDTIDIGQKKEEFQIENTEVIDEITTIPDRNNSN